MLPANTSNSSNATLAACTPRQQWLGWRNHCTAALAQPAAPASRTAVLCAPETVRLDPPRAHS